MIKQLLAGFAVIAFLDGCIKDVKQATPTCNYDTCSNAAPATEIQALKTYIDTSGIIATRHCSGVYYKIDSAGTGINPTPCSNIGITYKGMLTNGKVFDQNTAGAVFSLSNLIYGWRNTLPLLKEGGKIRLYIPPSLGYGDKDVKDDAGTVVIPANSILIFDITLIVVQ